MAAKTDNGLLFQVSSTIRWTEAQARGSQCAMWRIAGSDVDAVAL